MKKILITGGAGFIGSHVVRLFVNKYPDYLIINLDKLTYAGNLENLKDIENKPNYKFIKGDIVDSDFILQLFNEEQFDGVIHLAAESHVDRSYFEPNGIYLYQYYRNGKSVECSSTSMERVHLMIKDSIIFQRMKSMGPWEILVILLKKRLMIHIARIQHQKPVLIIL